MSEAVIDVSNVVTRFGETEVHSQVSFSIPRGQIVSLIGGSGCGKSTLLREIIGLQAPTEGTLKLLDVDVWRASNKELNAIRNRIGVLFQNGALFSALSAGENIAVPLHEQTRLPDDVIKHIVNLRLALSGLSTDTAQKMPSELSGGMRKRVALARALALEPEILFLDEPTSGLDPISARAFDELIRTLCDSLGLTVFMVTHDLDSLTTISDRIIVLGEGKVIADGAFREVVQVPHPWIAEYFKTRLQISQ